MKKELLLLGDEVNMRRSDQDYKVTSKELSKKLKVTSQAVHLAKNALVRTIEDVIKIFKGCLPGNDKYKPGGLQLHKARRRSG
jgi:hypothetical protein